MSDKSLYERLGGYDALVAVADNLLPRLAGDEQLARYWANRGEDGIQREKQLLVDFLASNSGGAMYYTGRDMLLSHKGMKISVADWDAFIGHLNATLDAFQVPEPERGEVLAFIDSTRTDIVETTPAQLSWYAASSSRKSSGSRCSDSLVEPTRSQNRIVR